jgi:hypothetical protein
MSAIGGYFGLELRQTGEYHSGAIRLNTGRNALEYILRARGYKKIFLPFYTCHVLLQPIEKLGMQYEYYQINEQLEPLFDYATLGHDDVFLYTNYFGLKNAYLQELVGQVENLIVDNAQAFYSRPLAGIDTFYSARKFFGVPDGAYLFTESSLANLFEQDFSTERCAHLLLRLDDSAEKGYANFVENDLALDHNPIRLMSRLTKSILDSIDYSAVSEQRISNFTYLHTALKKENELDIDFDTIGVPMVYPFLTNNAALRKYLMQERIYVAQYWPEVLSLVPANAIEHRFAANLIPLPIDQRLSTTHLDTIIKIISNAY